TQFAPQEDFGRYPRDEAGDAAKLASAGCDLMYAPAAAEMYAEGRATSIAVAGPAEGLCGAARPQMFGGVALVVTKLLLQAQPDFAVFGEKDYQQLHVVRRFVRDLDIPVEIVGLPTVREPDGLAISSRNAYLSPDDRRRAPALQRALAAGAAVSARGPQAVLDAAGAALAAEPALQVEYLELADPDLGPDPQVGRARLLAAARIGGTRLIDNVAVQL
ncbi:MAG: 4-phosphopantoate--beta-alanine ligase, partial [Pseudonocardia sp.]